VSSVSGLVVRVTAVVGQTEVKEAHQNGAIEVWQHECRDGAKVSRPDPRHRRPRCIVVGRQYRRVLREAGHRTGFVCLDSIPDGLSAEELTRYLRENGATICGG